MQSIQREWLSGTRMGMCLGSLRIRYLCLASSRCPGLVSSFLCVPSMESLVIARHEHPVSSGSQPTEPLQSSNLLKWKAHQQWQGSVDWRALQQCSSLQSSLQESYDMSRRLQITKGQSGMSAAGFLTSKVGHRSKTIIPLYLVLETVTWISHISMWWLKGQLWKDRLLSFKINPIGKTNVKQIQSVAFHTERGSELGNRSYLLVFPKSAPMASHRP